MAQSKTTKKAQNPLKLKSGWPSDPEARRQEMKRRIEVARQKRAAGTRIDINSFSTLQKHSLVRQFKNLLPNFRKAWLEERRIAPATMDYWRRKYDEQNPSKDSTPKVKLSKKASSIGDTYGPQVAAAFEYYKALPHHSKKPWREKHHLSGSQLYHISIGKATTFIASRMLDTNSQPSHSQALVPAFEIPLQMLPPAVPGPTQVTLEDAILALEVKRDHFNEFIDQLKVMMRGGRR